MGMKNTNVNDNYGAGYFDSVMADLSKKLSAKAQAQYNALPLWAKILDALHIRTAY